MTDLRDRQSNELMDFLTEARNMVQPPAIDYFFESEIEYMFEKAGFPHILRMSENTAYLRAIKDATRQMSPWCEAQAFRSKNPVRVHFLAFSNAEDAVYVKLATED